MTTYYSLGAGDRGRLRRAPQAKMGGVAERPKAAVLKTARVQALVGSNPTPSSPFFLQLDTIFHTIKLFGSGEVAETGLRQPPAKRLWGETSTQGSNPCLSAVFFVIFFASVLGLGACRREEVPAPPPPPSRPGIESPLPGVVQTVVVSERVRARWGSVRLVVEDRKRKSFSEQVAPLEGSLQITDTDLTVRVHEFLPDLAIREGVFVSLTEELRNPAVRVEVTEAGRVIFTGWLYANFPEVLGFQHERIGLRFVGPTEE